MIHRTIVLTALILALVASQGCVGRLIDEGIEKGLGPTAKMLPMDPKWPADQNFLAAYKNFALDPQIRTEFPDTPAEFLNFFPANLNNQLASKGLPIGKPGKTLVIGVTILAYQPVASYEKALGPTEEVVARVTLKDKDSGTVVGQAVCIGRTYQSVGLGPQWKAWGLSRAIVNKWLDNYYPKAGRIEGEEKGPPPSN